MSKENIVENIDFQEIYDNAQAVYKSQASLGRTFVGWDNSGTTVKSDYKRSDFDYMRNAGNQDISRHNMLRVCQEAYDKVGIIQNVINLMGDFGSKGIRFRHANKKLEKFVQKWAKKVGVPERSERFLNNLYRLGVVIIYEKYGRAVNDIKSKQIPIKYTFLNPAAVQAEEENSGIVPDEPVYKLLRYASESDRLFRKPGAGIPEALKDRVSNYKPLPAERLSVYHYRKDDWQFWGKPITYSILDDLEVLEKLKLADISALDGAISQVRLWTIGQITDSPQTTFFPTKPMLEKLRNILSNSLNGGTIDLVWGPELNFKESSTTVHNFLGEGKYKPHIDSIYDGLGIPSPLRSSNKESGSGGSNISLKTLIERLNYGRIYLVDFWTKQLAKLWEAMGFTEDLPIIEFDYMVLADEAAEKKLLLDMLDRDIIDIEAVLERFNFDPTISKSRLSEEMKQRGKDMPEKTGPFTDPHVADDMNKSLLQAGKVTPAEIGHKVNVPADQQEKRFIVPPEPAGTVKKAKKSNSVKGRPKNITETKKRQPKLAKAIWANSAQKEISEIFTPVALEIYNKKNVRSLSVEETETLEYTKAKLLLAIEPFTEINIETIAKAMSTEVDSKILNQLDVITKAMGEKFGRELTVEEKRNITSLYYSGVYYGEDNV